MTRFRSAGLRSLALALAAFAAAPPASADADSRLRVFGYTRAAPVETVPDSIIDDWKYLDDRNAMVFRRGQAYLLVLGTSCPALQSAGVIGFNAATSGLVAAKTLLVGSRNSSSECGVEQIVQLERVAFQPGPPAPAPARPAARAPARIPAPPPAAPAPQAAPAPVPAPAPAAPPPPPPAEPEAAPVAPPPPPAAEAPTSAPPPPRAIDPVIATPPGATPL